MSIFSFLRIEFSILGIVALTMIFPIFAAIAFGEFSVVPAFAIPMAFFLILATTFLFAGRKKKNFAFHSGRVHCRRFRMDFFFIARRDSFLF